MRRRLCSFCLVLLAWLTPLAAQTRSGSATLPDLFRKAKEEVKLGSYQRALASLAEIDTVSQQTGLEKDREALAPSLAFYRGVCHAALGQEQEARTDFTAYLETSPTTRLDPAMYPKKVVAAFEGAQKALTSPQPAADLPQGSGIAAAYRAFRTEDYSPHTSNNEDWASGPVRFLLTTVQIEEFQRLPDSVARSEFIVNFWKARDPKPETPENELQAEFERRVAFADRYFIQGEMRGSFTDRGTVFVLLGPPSRTSQRRIQTGEDTGDPAALYRFTPGQVTAAAAGGGSRSAQIARVDAVAGPGNSQVQPSNNWREVWRYLRVNLPTGLPYEWVDFDFISKQGYGEAVLQRDPATLDAMDRAKASLLASSRSGGS
jgi:GWxTD domain-containing protein